MGMFVAMSVTVIGAMSVSFFEKISWLFPMTHAIFGVHFDKFYAQPKYKIVWSLLYFLVLNILLFAENVFSGKKMQNRRQWMNQYMIDITDVGLTIRGREILHEINVQFECGKHMSGRT